VSRAPFVRTVVRDMDPVELGVTYAHEHLVIDVGRPVDMFPDFLLVDLDRMTNEIRSAVALGLRSVVDAMPAHAGRNVLSLVELSRRTGVHVIAPTGLHHARYYGDHHWSTRATVDELADLFAADVTDGIDERDYSGPIVLRTPHRAGVLKVAGSDGGPSPRDARVFQAAAEAHRRTGVPILTHCEHGTGALEQVRLLLDHGVDPAHVVLSHVDKVVDRGYHRDLLATGAFAEYDQSFRWGDDENGTLALLDWMIEDGFGDRIVLGMDAARQSYYRAYGGTPGLDFLLAGFTQAMAERGLDELVRRRLFVDNPARAFTFLSSSEAGAGVEPGHEDVLTRSEI
jgi:5-phospho-D-xylono-1,4-lactonase